MTKRSNSTKGKSNVKNVVLVLIEGNSEKSALEIPLLNFLDEFTGDEYRLLFAQKERPAVENEEDIEEIDFIDENDEIEELDESINDFELEEDFAHNDDFQHGGDITTAFFKAGDIKGIKQGYIRPHNIEQAIGQCFFIPAATEYYNKYKARIYAKHLLRVIHIVDLDGVYLPDDCVVSYLPCREGWDSLFYNAKDSKIETYSIQSTIKRNACKRKNLDYLLSKDTITIQGKQVPYKAYYFSSNLDHVLHHDPNMQGGKVTAASSFSTRYGDDAEELYEYFENLENGEFMGLSYEDSWNLIRKDENSIQPHSNFYTLLEEIRAGKFPKPR